MEANNNPAIGQDTLLLQAAQLTLSQGLAFLENNDKYMRVTHVTQKAQEGTGSTEMSQGRIDRLQIMLEPQELKALDDWRFQKRMPSRAAAVREIIRRGLAAEGFETALPGQSSASFGIINGNGEDR